MRDMSRPCVDPELERIYTNILIEKLEKPEEWTKKREDNNGQYRSTAIPETKTYFKTRGYTRDEEFITDNIIIKNGLQYDEDVYILPVETRRVRRLLRKLDQYMKLKAEWAEYEQIDKKLKQALPETIDRYLKLSKIKKRIQ